MKSPFNALSIEDTPIGLRRSFRPHVTQDEFPGSSTKSPTSLGSTTGTLHVYSTNVDKLWEQAVAAGAKIVMPLDNMFWGERYGQLADPFGHNWSLSMQIKMSLAEKETKRQEARSMFA